MQSINWRAAEFLAETAASGNICRTLLTRAIAAAPNNLSHLNIDKMMA